MASKAVARANRRARMLPNRGLDRERCSDIMRGSIPSIDQAMNAGLEPVSSAPEVGREGDVAIIRDDGTILISENLFDGLGAFRVKPQKKIGGVKLLKFRGSLRMPLGEKIELGDDDTIEMDFPPAGNFRFYGERYSSYFLNSDGNVTFGSGDAASTARSIGRFLAGAPRIAAFFRDLDPSGATGDGGVYVRTIGKKTQITWFEVPEFRQGTEPVRLVTVQMTLFKKGKITFVFRDVESESAIIGVSPGGDPTLDLVDLSEDLPGPPTTGAVAEQFSDEEQLDEAAIAQAFFQVFRDDYTHLIVYLDYRLVLPGTAIAYHLGTRNSIKGIGVPDAKEERFYLLGTDHLGRDMVSRLIYGGRISITVGVLGVLVSGSIGIFLGLIAGYYRGIIDDVIMRVVDVFMSVPLLFIALMVLFILGPSFINIIIVFAVARWMLYCRVTRGVVMSLREQTFVEAARAIGATDQRIITRHILPNLITPLLTIAALEVPRNILTESALSFLGFGIQPPESSWGLMLSAGREYITTAWWIVVIPGVAIFLTCLSFNLFGVWLRAVSDPLQRWMWLKQTKESKEAGIIF